MPKEISPEDKALFRKTVGALKPLKKKAVLQYVAPKPSARRRIIPEQDLPISGLSSAYSQEVDSETCLTYCHQSITNKRFKALKDGIFPIDSVLDLHGLRPDEAESQFITFIHDALQQGYRNVLIIHGKGGKESKKPVLKNLVNHWLKQLPEVLAFHSALSRDGGRGAVYLLLKRRRLNYPE